MKREILLLILLVLSACEKEVDPSLLPQACFESSTTESTPGEAVYFTNCTKKAYSYVWNFGDQTLSHDVNPNHVFYTDGAYEVVLYARNDDGSDSVKQIVTIKSHCEETLDTFDFSFGIDYDHPEKYLIPGDQSDLDDQYVEWVIQSAGEPEQTITYISKVCQFINRQFSVENAGGGMIGEVTANDLYDTKRVYGCHSQALAISSVLRKMGFPCLLVETASVRWAYQFLAHTNEGLTGHVMTEIFLNDHWILYDNNCTYVDEYDPLNPYISKTDFGPSGDAGLFVIARGVDTWEYYERMNAKTDELMYDFAFKLNCFEDYIHSVDYQWQ